VKGEASPVMANPGWFSLQRPSLQTVKAIPGADYLHLNPNPSLETSVEHVLASMSEGTSAVTERG